MDCKKAETKQAKHLAIMGARLLKKGERALAKQFLQAYAFYLETHPLYMQRHIKLRRRPPLASLIDK
jgi:hypothetical protein